MDKSLSPLVVGYKGEIGSFILQGLLKVFPKATNIYCIDVNETYKEQIDRVKKSNIIFLCVPIDQTVDWLIKFKRFLKNKVIIEQVSIKKIIFNDKRFEQIEHLNIKSMHILFKPSMTANHERSIALINPEKARYLSTKVNRYWDDYVDDFREMFNLINTNDIIFYHDYEQHDRDMSIQQALVHKTLLILNSMLQNTSSGTFVSRKIRELCNRMMVGDRNLYRIIQEEASSNDIEEYFVTLFKDFDIKKYLFLN